MNYKTINLVDYTKSDISYYINKYPDGHKHIVLEGCEWNKEPLINIIVRIDSIDMLFILLQVISVLKHERILINELHITYLLTARCDRRFSMGEAIDLDLVGNLLYDLDIIKKYVFYDVHNLPSIFRSMKNVENKMVLPRHLNPTNYNICYPDKGALDRYSAKFGFGSLVGEKHRKPDGISINLIKTAYLESKPILVIDDLCDGGGTFAALASELDEKYNQLSRQIWVTHAIQKSGIELLAAKYNKVYITNSYKDWNKEKLPDNITVYDITRYV